MKSSRRPSADSSSSPSAARRTTTFPVTLGVAPFDESMETSAATAATAQLYPPVSSSGVPAAHANGHGHGHPTMSQLMDPSNLEDLLGLEHFLTTNDMGHTLFQHHHHQQQQSQAAAAAAAAAAASASASATFNPNSSRHHPYGGLSAYQQMQQQQQQLHLQQQYNTLAATSHASVTAAASIYDSAFMDSGRDANYHDALARAGVTAATLGHLEDGDMGTANMSLSPTTTDIAVHPNTSSGSDTYSHESGDRDQDQEVVPSRHFRSPSFSPEPTPVTIVPDICPKCERPVKKSKKGTYSLKWNRCDPCRKKRERLCKKHKRTSKQAVRARRIKEIGSRQREVAVTELAKHAQQLLRVMGTTKQREQTKPNRHHIPVDSDALHVLLIELAGERVDLGLTKLSRREYEIVNKGLSGLLISVVNLKLLEQGFLGEQLFSFDDLVITLREGSIKVYVKCREDMDNITRKRMFLALQQCTDYKHFPELFVEAMSLASPTVPPVFPETHDVSSAEFAAHVASLVVAAHNERDLTYLDGLITDDFDKARLTSVQHHIVHYEVVDVTFWSDDLQGVDQVVVHGWSIEHMMLSEFDLELTFVSNDDEDGYGYALASAHFFQPGVHFDFQPRFESIDGEPLTKESLAAYYLPPMTASNESLNSLHEAQCRSPSSCSTDSSQIELMVVPDDDEDAGLDQQHLTGMLSDLLVSAEVPQKPARRKGLAAFFGKLFTGKKGNKHVGDVLELVAEKPGEFGLELESQSFVDEDGKATYFLCVSRVEEYSPSYFVGLKPGHLVLRLNGEAMWSKDPSAALSRARQTLEAVESVELMVQTYPMGSPADKSPQSSLSGAVAVPARFADDKIKVAAAAASAAGPVTVAAHAVLRPQPTVAAPLVSSV